MNPSRLLKTRRLVIEQALKNAPTDPSKLTAESLARAIEHIAGDVFDSSIELAYQSDQPTRVEKANSRSGTLDRDGASEVAKMFANGMATDTNNELCQK